MASNILGQDDVLRDLGLSTPTELTLKGVAAGFYAYHAVKFLPSVVCQLQSENLYAAFSADAFAAHRHTFAGAFFAAASASGTKCNPLRPSTRLSE